MRRGSGGIKKKDCSSSGRDLLSRLPPELAVAVLEELGSAELTRVPRVCPAWRSMFAEDSPYASCLRAALRRRFGCRVPVAVSGRMYLQMRIETCHLCSGGTVQPFVYAASSALSIISASTSLAEQPTTLFPVCAACALAQLKRTEFDVVIDTAQLHFVLPSLPSEMGSDDNAVQAYHGFLYSDTTRFRGVRLSEPLFCVRADSLTAFFKNSIFETE